MDHQLYSFVLSDPQGNSRTIYSPTTLYFNLLDMIGCDEWLASQTYQWATEAKPGDHYKGKKFVNGKIETIFIVELLERTIDLQRSDSLFRFQ